jgi:hypothetical protein
VGARIVRVDQVAAARQQSGPDESCLGHLETGLPGGRCERRAGARQQGAFHSPGGQPFHQPQRLPLAAAHLFARIQVEDAHQLMFLALEYFRNV